jgi:hypothetical protein
MAKLSIFFLQMTWDRPHAKEESYYVESPDQQFIHDQDQREGNHSDDQELEQDARFPADDEKADRKDDCLME